MSSRPAGFPERFPVRTDGKRPLRYHLVSASSRIVLRSWFGPGLLIQGGEHFPLQGPLLVVCNHLSNIDPFLFGAYAPGTMFCMAKRELYSNAFVSWLLAGCNCFPVDRGTPDRWALRTSLQLLAAGERLLVFLEGTRASAQGMKRAEAGVGFLVRRARVPVLPAAVWGTERALGRGRLLPRRVGVHLRYGDVFQPEAGAGAHRQDLAIADAIGARVAALLPPRYRGYYA